MRHDESLSLGLVILLPTRKSNPTPHFCAGAIRRRSARATPSDAVATALCRRAVDAPPPADAPTERGGYSTEQRGCSLEVIALIHQKDQIENARPRLEMIARLNGRNPDGVVGLVERSTQGSRAAATRGWRSKSRWDLLTGRQHSAPSLNPLSRLVGVRSKTSLNRYPASGRNAEFS